MSRQKIRHLDTYFNQLKKAVPFLKNSEGWSYTIRTSLNMTLKQLATRCGMAAPNISRIEKSERDGTVTLNTLEKMAQAMGCECVCLFVPQTSLADFTEKQAKLYAEDIILKTNDSMIIERQGLDSDSLKDSIDDLTQDLLRKTDKAIWNYHA